MKSTIDYRPRLTRRDLDFLIDLLDGRDVRSTLEGRLQIYGLRRKLSRLISK